MISVYYSFGEYDGVVIYEVPDERSAAAAVMTAISPGILKAIRTTSLLSVEDAMEAMRRAGEIEYRRLGQQ